MSSFFREDDDSDQEQEQKRRKKLESIREDQFKLTPGTHGQSGQIAEPENEDLSEEKELERLRQSERYKRYAAETRREKRQPSPPLKRSRTHLADDDCSVGEGSDKDDQDGEEHDGEAEEVIEWGQRGGRIPNSMRSVRDGPVVVRRSSSGGPNVDPKIIDDSSDDTSREGSDGEEAPPLGPMLPPHLLRSAEGPLSLDHLPIHNEAILGSAHDSYVSCLALDKAGNRLISGSLDSTVKFWDFHAMTRSLLSFRTSNPMEESPLRHLQYSSTGSMVLCSGRAHSAMVLDREGTVLSQTAKGDMYIVDSSRTKGHTGSILAAKWKPSGASPSTTLVTASADATMRIWDVRRTDRIPMADHPVITQQKVVKLRNARGGKAIASALDWLPDGKLSVLGCNDGKIRLMDLASLTLRPVDESSGVVASGEEITSVCCAPATCAAPLVLVRSTNDCLHVFDRRKMLKPVHEFTDLPNTVSETNACFVGETGDYFLTGTSANRKGGTRKGTIRLYERQSLREVWKSEMDDATGSVVCSLWHSSLNQVIFGGGDGRVHILYNPSESSRGILSCLSRSDYRKSHGVVALGFGEVVPASSLNIRRGEIVGSTKGIQSKSNRQRREISNAMKPKPYSGPAVTREDMSTTLAKHLSAKDVSKEWTQDPREAILRYADVAERDPQFTNAYRETQPETILAKKTAEQEEEETRRKLYERDRLRNIRRDDAN